MLCINQGTLHSMISLFVDFNAATKCIQKRVQKTFHLKVATVSALMSGDVLGMEAIYNFYIRITQTII